MKTYSSDHWSAPQLNREVPEVRRIDLSAVVQLWHAARLLYPRPGARALARRLRFVALAARSRQMLAPLLHAETFPLLGQIVHHRPHVLGFILAPYLCTAWSVPDRIAAFCRHVAVLERFPGLLDFDLDRQVALMPLPHLGDGYRLVLDKPEWLHREGVVAFNLFRGDVRLFSLVFALDAAADGLVAYIGGVQGRDLDGMLDEYRAITRASFGMRPRDLLIELFRVFVGALGARHIYGVADASRHGRSRFFGAPRGHKFHLNYDEVWRDRGGVPAGDFFRLSPSRNDRASETIPARKRTIYRKRYTLMDDLETALRGVIRSARSKPASDRK